MKDNSIYKKKQPVFESPDLSKLQAVVIDSRTTLYIALGASIDEARKKYLTRQNSK